MLGLRDVEVSHHVTSGMALVPFQVVVTVSQAVFPTTWAVLEHFEYFCAIKRWYKSVPPNVYVEERDPEMFGEMLRYYRLSSPGLWKWSMRSKGRLYCEQMQHELDFYNCTDEKLRKDLTWCFDRPVVPLPIQADMFDIPAPFACQKDLGIGPPYLVGECLIVADFPHLIPDLAQVLRVWDRKGLECIMIRYIYWSRDWDEILPYSSSRIFRRATDSDLASCAHKRQIWMAQLYDEDFEPPLKRTRLLA